MPVADEKGTPLEVGTTVGRGQYRVEGVLGDGGMATVYRVRHSVLQSQHALKVLDPELAREEGIRDRFLAEGRILAQLKHPNLVSVTDVVVEQGIAGLIQELLQGETLEDLIERRGVVPIEDIVSILVPVLQAVHHAHEAGIVHRDLKPSNIFLEDLAGSGLRPVVLDFGVARLDRSSQINHTVKHETRAGSTLGTAHYMSPEQVRAPGSVDRRTDVFALGAILYEMATGEVAFDGDSEFDVMRRIVDGTPGAGPERVSIAAPLDAVVRRALAPEPDERFDDCLQIAAALERAAQPRRRRRKRRRSAHEVDPAVGTGSAIPDAEHEGSALHRLAEVLLGLVGAEFALAAGVLAQLLSVELTGWPRFAAFAVGAAVGAPGIYCLYRGVLFGFWLAERPLLRSGTDFAPWDEKVGLRERFRPSGLAGLRALLYLLEAVVCAGIFWWLWLSVEPQWHAFWAAPMAVALVSLALDHGWMAVRFLFVGWGRRPIRLDRRIFRRDSTDE
jgi:tRNA A-37 threonylcarbamoyl transferase component Bud32